MTLSELKKAYQNKEILKPEYIDWMHKLHQSLYDYADFIKDTDVAKIEIMDGCVLMMMRESNIKIICDRMDKRIVPMEALNFGQYEKAELDMIAALIEEGYSIFDIGANIGWYTLVLSKRFKNVQIFSFEPIPNTFDYLKRHIEINGVFNARIFNLGFSDREEERTFYFYPECSGNASASNLTGRDDIQEIVCSLRRFDDFVHRERVTVDFIKCDVEGSELFVFQGAIGTIRAQKPVIFTEMLRKWSTGFGYDPNEIIRLLSGVGYRCFTVYGGRLREFFVMDENTTETNFFFLHSEKHASKISRFCAV